MKKIFVILIFALTTTIALAQTNSSDHLSFKGVPIDGTLNEYVAKLKQSGFTMLGTENEVVMLNGDFASYKGCIIGVSTIKGKDLVSKITVIFPALESWSLLASNYFNLKAMLTEKYGEPAESNEKFDTYAEPKDDGMKFMYVQLDKCKYYSIFKIEKGNIELQIKGNHSSSFVILSYFDKINSDIVKQKAIDDL
ncbi:MAG: hypothetical protein PHT07_14475 [Paludibacter sp.]|nr:hypothetical protein [Paludibacter sp.]